MPVVRSSEFASAIVTRSLTPSNDRAPPVCPWADHVAPLMVPLFPLPETSARAEPEPASNEYAATRPAEGGGVGTVALASLELGEMLPAASWAVTR
jgi:hypothetical protein